MTPEVFIAERAGDRAVRIRFAARPSRELSAFLIALAEQSRTIPDVVDAVPGHRTVLIETAPGSAAGVAELVGRLQPMRRSSGWRTYTIPVGYDGPDLDWASAYLAMPPEEIVRMHSAATYDVRLIGSPGFVYLSQAPAQLHMPRLDEPRREVPPGAVGIGGRQTGIYRRAMPGGWRLLGTASEVPELRPGDRVRFAAT